MALKRKIESVEFDTRAGRAKSPDQLRTFVTFRNGHMLLDVRGLLLSKEGSASAKRVINRSKALPQLLVRPRKVK